jgi:hypothetical protein
MKGRGASSSSHVAVNPAVLSIRKVRTEERQNESWKDLRLQVRRYSFDFDNCNATNCLLLVLSDRHFISFELGHQEFKRLCTLGSHFNEPHQIGNTNLVKEFISIGDSACIGNTRLLGGSHRSCLEEKYKRLASHVKTGYPSALQNGRCKDLQAGRLEFPVKRKYSRR